MLAALARPGLWRRAGMGGEIVGLDLTEAMASLPAGLDREFCRRLFVIAETEFLRALPREDDQAAPRRRRPQG